MKSINKIIFKIFLFIGIIEIISSIIIYPEIAKYWRHENIINYYKPMLNYTIFAILIGGLTVVLGFIVLKSKYQIIINIIITIFILSIIFLSDRLILAKVGLSLWDYDKVLIYKQRPNTTFSWGSEYNNKLIHINKFGFHDDEFKLKKAQEEIRILVLGNSIVMGHGVTRNETFSNQLEFLLNYSLKSNHSYQVIDAGVQGYSTSQELEMFKRSLKFNPDIIVDGFCLNDITEPIFINKKYGGIGYDYHNIYQISNEILGFIINNTGYGRLITKLKFKNKISNAKNIELNSVDSLCNNPFFNKSVTISWRRNLADILSMKQLADSLSKPFIILIFPYTSQLFRGSLQKPQKYLESFLQGMKINYIDFTEVFQHRIKVDLSKLSANISNKIMNNQISKYYLDEDHYTSIGHQVIAKKLYNYLLEESFINN